MRNWSNRYWKTGKARKGCWGNTDSRCRKQPSPVLGKRRGLLEWSSSDEAGAELGPRPLGKDAGCPGPVSLRVYRAVSPASVEHSRKPEPAAAAGMENRC